MANDNPSIEEMRASFGSEPAVNQSTEPDMEWMEMAVEDNPGVDQMRDSFDSEAEVNQSNDPDMEAMRSEITGESAMLPESGFDYGKSDIQNAAEGTYDFGVSALSSIPIITPLADKALAAAHSAVSEGDFMEGYNKRFKNISSAREALMKQAEERSPIASFTGSMVGSMGVPAGGVGMLGRAAYEGGLAMTDAAMRGRTSPQAGIEGGMAAGMQSAMSALPWLRGIFPGTEVTPKIINQAYAKMSSFIRPSNKLGADEVADLYGDVAGRRLVRAYEGGELQRKSGEQGPEMSLIQNTKEVATDLESSFRELQKSFGERYSNFKAKFIAPSSYQDFMTTADNIHYLQEIASDIELRPYEYSGPVKSAIKDSLMMFEGGIKSQYKSLKGAKTFGQLSDNSTKLFNTLKGRYDAAKTGAEQDKISSQMMLLYTKHQDDMKLATRLGKETMIKFRRKMDSLIGDISKSTDPSIFSNRETDITILNDLKNRASDALGKDYIRSESMVDANVGYSTYKEGVNDLFEFLAESKAQKKHGDFRVGGVDPYKLYSGLTTQGIPKADKFRSAVTKMKDYISADTKEIQEVVEKAGIKPAFARMQQLVDVITKKAQMEKARTAGGPSSMAVDEGVRTMLLSSGDKKKIAFAMLWAPIGNPLGWTNMIDNFADAFSTKANKVNPDALSKWWDKASRKAFKAWPGFVGGQKAGQQLPNVLPGGQSARGGMPIDPRAIAARIGDNPAAAATKGLVRPYRYRTMPKGDEFVGFNPEDTELLRPFPWSPYEDESAVMPENIKSSADVKKKVK